MAVTFSSQLFAPTPSLFGGVGSSGGLVPHVYDVEIGGRPYMIDLGSDAYITALEQRLRDSVDQGNVPGENSVSSQGLWRRSQDTWHLGAGQYWADTQEAQYGRFWTSVGVDPFTVKGELSLLKQATVVDAQTESNLYMTRANGRIYGSDGQTLRFATAGNFGSPTTVTGTAAADILGLASNGYNVVISQGASGLYKTDAGVSTAATFITGITAGPVGFAKGRLMLGGSGADKAKLWNITTAFSTTANNPTVMYTHPNANFEWVAFAEGPNHIYCAGHTGSESLIYRTEVKADGTGLDIPVVAGTLPMGEVVKAMYGYLGFLFIGTNKGVRMATADQNGDLVFGANIATGSDVNCFGGNDRFVFFGWSNHPSGFAGTGAIDLAYLTASNTPAYCSWFYLPSNTGTVVDLEVFDDQVIFSVAAVGFCGEGTDLVTEGYLETGAWTYGIPDTKIIAKIDGRHDPLPATDTVRMAIKVDGGSWLECGCVASTGSPTTLFSPQQTPGFKIEAKIILKRATTTTGPTFNRVNYRAYVNPARSLVIQVPVLLHPRLNVDGLDVDLDVVDELSHLRGLATQAQITTYVDSMLSVRCLVEDVRWVPDNNRDSIDRRWAGTALVTMRTVDEL